MFKDTQYKDKMLKTIEVFVKELSSLRTGRANASMLDLVKVDVYGQQMPINQLASITTPEARTITNLNAETTIRLSQIPNIVGIKEASSDFDQISYIIDGTNEDFKVWSGNDDETFHIMSMGGYGVAGISRPVKAIITGKKFIMFVGYSERIWKLCRVFEIKLSFIVINSD